MSHGMHRAPGVYGVLWSWIPTVLLVSVLSVLSAGCPAPTAYQPNDRIVNELGAERSKQRLKEVLLRSINPQVVEAEVTDEYFAYRYRQAVAGFQTGAVLDNRVFYPNAVSVNVYDNNTVNVLTSNQQLIAQLIFGNSADARLFADIVTSFRLRKSGRTR